MAKNEFESMGESFAQGSIDCTYIQLTPNRKMVENPPIDRLTWPRYENAERWPSDPFVEAHVNRLPLPREIKTTGDGDTRF
jgi:hypothetical protein